MSMLRAVIVMLHSVVKELAERETDHALLTRSLDVYEIDHDGADVTTLYAACYKEQRERILALIAADYKRYGRGKKRSEYALGWLSAFDSRDRRALSNVIHNSGSRNFDTFSDDNSYRGSSVAIPLARARVKVARHKELAKPRGYVRSARFRFEIPEATRDHWLAQAVFNLAMIRAYAIAHS